MRVQSFILLGIFVAALGAISGCGNSSTSTCTGNACPAAPQANNASGPSATTGPTALNLSYYFQQSVLNDLSTSNAVPALTGAITSLTGDFTFSGSSIQNSSQLEGKLVFSDFSQIMKSCSGDGDPTLTMELLDASTQAVIQAAVTPADQEIPIDFTKSYIVRVSATNPTPCTSFDYGFVVIVK